MRKPKYAELFTLRPDGRYQGYWHDLDRDGRPIKSKRHTICDRDPERLMRRIEEKEKPKKPTLRAVADEWERIHREEVAERTWKNYAPHVAEIVELYGDCQIADITAFDVSQDLLSAKAKGYSYSIVNARRSIWNGIFDYAMSQRIIPYNPATSVKLPKGLKIGKRTAPTNEIINAIIADANDMDFGFIPFFLLCTGLRRSEALQRKKVDVDTVEWKITIPKAKTKAGIRTVPIIEPLQEPLRKWMASHPGEYLFPHRDYSAGRKAVSGYMSDRNWETAWQAYCDRHGWVDENGKPVIGAHHLRHGTATLLYEAGVDMYTAQHILGHANVTTTLSIYTDLRTEHEKKNVGLFSESIKSMLKGITSK